MHSFIQYFSKMNKMHNDTTWELAAAKIHLEPFAGDENEFDEMVLQEENKKIYRSVQKIHNLLTDSKILKNSSVLNSWEKITRSLHQKQKRLYFRVFKYAAVFVLTAGAGIILSQFLKPLKTMPYQNSEIYVPLGQMSEITLYDGTHVWLNSGTILKYSNHFALKSREVILEGEAFFKVQPGEIPFKVKIKDKEVEVFGTSFAAVAYPDENFCQVILVEGSVQLNDKEGRFLKKIAPNQMLHIPDNQTERISIYEVNPLFYQSWIEGQIRFDNEMLSDVARRMERWYNVDINFTTKEAGEIKFTGTVLKNKPVDQSIQAISLLLPIKVEYENNLDIKDVITISKK